jgi:glycosyltransferase involved in cell wall biosynthesis
VGGQYNNKDKLYKLFFGRYELKCEIQDKVVADGIVVLSEYLRKKAQCFKKDDSIIKVHGGADLDYIQYYSDNSEIKKTLGISQEFLTFGYLDAYDKALSELKYFIEAFVELKDILKLKLIVFGVKLNSEISEKLGNGLINIEWIDFSRDASKFACVDVFLMLKEDNIVNTAGWPNKIGEYMACGRPILLNPVGEMIEFAKLHSDAFFITENNQKAIKKIMMKIYEHKNDLLKLGKINRDISEQEMSWDIRSKQLFSFYKKIYESINPTT